MLEVQQRHHQTGGQTRPTSIGDVATGNGRDRDKQVHVLDLLASLDLTSPALRKGSFDFLPRHSIGQHRQRMAQIDHLIQAITEKVIGHGAAFKTPRKQAPLNVYLRVLTIRIHPTSQAFMRVAGVLQGRRFRLLSST
jgi:hypothetical protein